MEMLDNIFYMYSKMNSSSQILLFLIILVGLMLISISIINVITRKKNEKYDMQFNPIDRYTSTISRKEELKKKTSTEKIKLEETKEIKLPKEEVIEEIETLEEPEIVEIVSDDNSIDKIAELL